MKRLRVQTIGLLVVCAAVLAACGSSSPSGTTDGTAASGTAASGTAPTIAFGYQKTVWGIPMIVAQKINAWHGLNVNVQTTALSAGTAVTQGLLGGSLQAGSLGSTPFIVGAAKGQLVAVAVVAYAGATVAVVVRKGSGISSVSDLRGKKIGTQLGSSTNSIFETMVAPKSGLTPGSYTPVNTTFQNMYSLLAAGQIDAFLGVEPAPALAVANGTGTVLTTYLKYDPTPLYVTFTQSFVKSNPQAVVRFLEGWLRVVQEFRQHPDAAADLSQSAFTKSGVTIPKEVLRTSVNELQVTPQFASDTDQYLTDQAEQLVKQGVITAVPDWNTVINTKYLNEAAKTIGISLTSSATP